MARRQAFEERSVHAVHEYRRTPQPTTPQAILTSILLRPCSACIPTLLQRSLCRKLTIRIVNANLHFVIIFRAFLAAGIGVRARFLRHRCFVACGFLRGTIETILHRIARVFQLFDDHLVLLVEADGDFDVLLRGLRGTCHRCQLRSERFDICLRLFRHIQSQFVRVNEREGREMRRRKFVILFAADGQDSACQLLDLAVICDVNRCDFLAEQTGNEFNHDGRFTLVEVRDDLITRFDYQTDHMTVCTRGLLLRLGRLRHLAHFQCNRRALCRAEYGLDRLLIERDLAVFGVDRQIGIGLVSHILHEGHIERQLHIVRALAVCLADLKDNLCGLLLRSLLENFFLIISGNHDSPDRLKYASEILKRHHIYLAGNVPERPEEHIEKVTLHDAYGEVDFYLLPFMKPAYVKNIFVDGTPETYSDAVKEIIKREKIDYKDKRNVLVSHQFYVGEKAESPETCDSEVFSVGGIDNVDIGSVKEFDYVALGHLHGAQCIGKPEIRYCGTLLKYSVSESTQNKSLTVVTLKARSRKLKITRCIR